MICLYDIELNTNDIRCRATMLTTRSINLARSVATLELNYRYFSEKKLNLSWACLEPV